MKHFEYKIYDSVYKDMITRKKNIEFRLLNEKSSQIKIGDEIKFSVINNEEKHLLVEVTNLYIYNNIEELWNSKEITNNNLNYTKDEFINTFYQIFGKEKVTNSKIIGIEFIIKESGEYK